MERTFFEKIKDDYGLPATIKMKEFMKHNKLVVRLKCKRNYLTKLRRNKIFPKFITDNCRRFHHLYNESSMHTVSNFIDGIKMKYLNICINGTFRSLKYAERKLFKIKCDIFKLIPENIATEYFARQKINSNKLKAEITCRHDHKYTTLMNRCTLKGHNNWFMNLTDINIPDSSKMVLGLGPKFNLPYDNKNLPIKNIISEVENIIREIPEEHTEEKDEIRRQISTSISSFKLRGNINKSPQDIIYNCYQ